MVVVAASATSAVVAVVFPDGLGTDYHTGRLRYGPLDSVDDAANDRVGGDTERIGATRRDDGYRFPEPFVFMR
jgi:hypothetical protein